MATTTRAILRQLLSEAMDDFEALTSSGAGDTTSIIDTSLANLVNGGDDDAFKGWYAMIADACHASDGEIRRVASYSASAFDITVEEAFTNTFGSGTTYELHRYNPTLKHNMINRALEALWPELYLPLRDERIVVDNLLANNDFDIFSSGFTNWVEVGSPTVTQETTRVIQGASSAKVISGGGADGQLTQAPTVNIPTIEGEEVTFKCWVYTTTTTTARLRLDWGGAVFDNGDYHTGADQWELLSVNGKVPSGATQVKAICEVASGTKTAFFDASWLTILPIYTYLLDANFLLGPYAVYQQIDEENPGSGYNILVGTPIQGRRLRLVGKGILSRLTSDTSTTEIDDLQAQLVVAKAAEFLNRALATGASTFQRERFQDDMELWREEVDTLRARPGIRGRAMPVHIANLAEQTSPWHMEEDSTGRIFVLDDSRGSGDGLKFRTAP